MPFTFSTSDRIDKALTTNGGFAGVVLFREGNLKQKMVPFFGIIAGLVLIMM